MRLPNDNQRLVIVGRTGSGKTVAGLWHLSQRDLHVMPWIMLDWKRDKMIAKSGAVEISIKGRLPKKPGLYVIRPLPSDEDLVEEFLWKVWAHGNIGLYFDEGYMAGDSAPFRAIQTQGRSKLIPTIILSQRPVWMSRFVFSEADFYQVFHLNDARDRKTIASFLPKVPDERLPNYHSHYYDVGNDELIILKPVPSEDEILAKLRPPEKKRLFIFS